MGISGLLPFLENVSRKCYLNEFRGHTVAIDSYCWLHKGAFSCAEKLVRGEDTRAHIMYCMKYIQLLLSYNIKPIMVFDGQHLPAKKDTESKRREQRRIARTRATELLRLGKRDEAQQFYRQCVDITHDMALELMNECRSRNVDCIVAPYEADAELAYLNIQRIVDIVITEDSDLVIFGCSKILFKLSFDGSATLVEKDKLYLAMNMKPTEYSFDKFRYMCIMSGCDYLDSLPGVGLKRAHKAVVMTADPNIYNLLRRLPSYLNLKKLTVPAEYLENFKLADATIRHQVVFDPVKRRQVRLTDPEDSGISSEYLRNAGVIIDAEKALQMALGNIDPFSQQIKNDWDPDNPSTSSIWSRHYKKPQVVEKPKYLGSRLQSTKNSVVKMSTTSLQSTVKHQGSNINKALQEQQMNEYDAQLSEELKMYQTMEPLPKKQKVIEEEKMEESRVVEIINPFSKRKKLSKFETTNLDAHERIVSPFFASKKEKMPKYDIINVEESQECANLPEEKQDSEFSFNSFKHEEVNKLSAVEDEISVIESDIVLQEVQETVQTSPIVAKARKRNSLQNFKFNSCKKKLITQQSIAEKLQHKERKNEDEVGIENLTPPEYLTNKSSAEITKTEEHKIELVSDGLIKEVEKKILKRSTSCSTVRLSEFKKKTERTASQPTILSMFSKMSKNDISNKNC